MTTLSILSANNFPLPAIEDAAPHSAQQVTIEITDLCLKKMEVTILPESAKPKLDAPLIGGYRTPLDLDLTGLRAPGEAIEIVVKINDPSTTAYFRTDGLDVSAGDSDSQTHMRRPKLPLGAGTKPTSITFYAIREDTVPALLFNLGILIEDGVYTTPIFIDPKIKNDG